MDNTLQHHGILGQKWGVRRFQNRDGTLTSAGKMKYSDADSSVTKKVKTDYNNLSDSEFRNKYMTSKEKYAKRVSKYGDPYMNSPLAKAGKNLVERDKRKKAKIAKRSDVKNREILTDEQIKKKIERLQMEKQLRKLTEEEINPGRAEAKRVLSQIGTKVASTAITGAALYGAKAAVTKQFDAKEFGNAVFNGGPKKK